MRGIFLLFNRVIKMADVSSRTKPWIVVLTSRRINRNLLCAGALCAGLFVLPPFSYADNKDQLKNIMANIAQQEKNVKEQQNRRELLQKQLQQQEKTIAQSSRSLRQTQKNLTALNGDVSKLSQSISGLRSQQQKHLGYLAKQLDEAFKMGRHTGMQTIFDNQNSQRSERMLAYYSYLNAARQKNIAELKQISTQLSEQRTQLQQKQTQQKNLLSQQQAEQKKFEKAKQEREKTLTELSASLQKNQQKLNELKQNETKLRNQIAKAERDAKARADKEAKEAEKLRQKQQQAQKSGSTYVPTQAEKELMARTGGLGKPAGQAIWPVTGRILHRFGELLQGEIRWKGLVIAAPEGSEVKAISDGRVLLADWLQGYGLVIVVEHGKTDLSLYGYNQSVLVNVGDNVKAGQAIGLVGISGGQKQPSLYFEIRRQGQAVDPQPWLRK
jgi:septal ring factor EnvC (AmiA/AmiB activator)